MKEYKITNYVKNPINFHVFRGEHYEPYPLHTHNFAEFTIITSGKAMHNVNGFTYKIAKGDAYIILPGVYHELISADNLHQYSFMFNMDNLSLFDIELKNMPGFYTFFSTYQKNDFFNRVHIEDEDLSAVFLLCELMLEEYSRKKAGYEITLRALLISLITIILRNIPQEDNDTYNIFRRISPSVKYIEEHYAEKLTLQQLADINFISPRQLTRLYSHLFSVSPMEYLVNYRLTQAYLMLRTSKNSIGTIARECGFYDESHFSRLFKNRFFMNPSELRARFK